MHGHWKLPLGWSTLKTTGDATCKMASILRTASSKAFSTVISATSTNSSLPASTSLLKQFRHCSAFMVERTVPRTVYPSLRSSLIIHEAMNPLAPVTKTLAGGDTVGIPFCRKISLLLTLIYSQSYHRFTSEQDSPETSVSHASLHKHYLVNQCSTSDFTACVIFLTDFPTIHYAPTIVQNPQNPSLAFEHTKSSASAFYYALRFRFRLRVFF